MLLLVILLLLSYGDCCLKCVSCKFKLNTNRNINCNYNKMFLYKKHSDNNPNHIFMFINDRNDKTDDITINDDNRNNNDNKNNDNNNTDNNNNDNDNYKTLKDTMIEWIKWYKRTLSPIMPPNCRFLPTCSSYGNNKYIHYNDKSDNFNDDTNRYRFNRKIWTLEGRHINSLENNEM